MRKIKLTPGQYEAFETTVEMIIHNKSLLERYKLIEDPNLRETKIKRIYSMFEYPIFKLPLGNSKKLWTGKISEAARIELLTFDNPKVEREHFWQRKIVLRLLFGEWFNILENEGAEGLIDLYFNKPGFGLFHITTSSENQILEKLQCVENTLSPDELYKKAGIILIDTPSDLLGKKRPNMSWYKSVNEKYYKLLEA